MNTHGTPTCTAGWLWLSGGPRFAPLSAWLRAAGMARWVWTRWAALVVRRLVPAWPRLSSAALSEWLSLPEPQFPCLCNGVNAQSVGRVVATEATARAPGAGGAASRDQVRPEPWEGGGCGSGHTGMPAHRLPPPPRPASPVPTPRRACSPALPSASLGLWDATIAPPPQLTQPVGSPEGGRWGGQPSGCLGPGLQQPNRPTLGKSPAVPRSQGLGQGRADEITLRHKLTSPPPPPPSGRSHSPRLVNVLLCTLWKGKEC